MEHILRSGERVRVQFAETRREATVLDVINDNADGYHPMVWLQVDGETARRLVYQSEVIPVGGAS